MRKWFHVVKRAFSASECEEIVKHAQMHLAVEATVGHGGGSVVAPNVRVSTIRWLKRHDPVMRVVYDVIEAETHAANADFFGKDVRSFNSVQFTEYPPGAVYNWHQDCTKVPSEAKLTPFDRQLSVCVQLSHRNSYEGGDFRINPSGTKETIRDFIDIGDMIIFPSELYHKVTPVTEGIRYSLVTWWVGPRY